MKTLALRLAGLILWLAGSGNLQELNAAPDQVISMKAVRHPNNALPDSFFGMGTKDGRFWDQIYPVVNGIPDSLKEVKIYYHSLNNVQALFQGFKAGVVPQKDFDYYLGAWGQDTAGCSPKKMRIHVVLASGISPKGKKYYLLDTNKDDSFSDEIPFILGSLQNPDSPHKVLYDKYLNGRIMTDSTWVTFREMNIPGRDMMGIHFAEYTEASFALDSVKYRVKASAHSTDYTNGTSFEITGNDGTTQKMGNGELFKIGGGYYQVDCSKDGLKITLTKILKFEGGTQLGMAPIPFKSQMLNGKEINFPADFKGKYVLLDFWATSCGPCIQEMRDHYINVYKKYGGLKFEIIAVADNTAEQLNDFVKKNNFTWITIPDGKIKEIQKKYRIHSYPTLFLINPEGVIKAKDRDLRSGGLERILDIIN